MKLTKLQREVLLNLLDSKSGLILVRDKNVKPVSMVTGNALTETDKNKQENLLVPVDRRVFNKLKEMSLLEFVRGGSESGLLYGPTDVAKANKNTIKNSKLYSNKASRAKLKEVAAKYDCTLEFDAVPQLFKLKLKSDTKKLSEPYIDVSENGIKVTQLTDLTYSEWQDEIANVYKRSDICEI